MERTLTEAWFGERVAVAVTVTPDGRRVLSDVGLLHTACVGLGDRHRGAQRSGMVFEVNAMAVMPDGRQVIVAWSDGTLNVWNLVTGTLERMLIKHAASARDSGDAGRAASDCGVE